MSRLPRVTPIGVPVHIIQRGNNRQLCFGSEEDMLAFVGWLKEYSTNYAVDVHAWVLMSNHVHLLCTPQQQNKWGQSKIKYAILLIFVERAEKDQKMSRLPRVTPIGVPVHIIQRGNNRQLCFGSEEDMLAFVGWLKEYSTNYAVDVHAWVLMSNHVHLLCTPQQNGAVSQMMQSLGRKFVRYFNFQYQRTGTLWEGRYKSSLVQSERYLIEVYRYIELNLVRADMVDDPGDYVWSSYQINALGKESELCTPHREYLRLGRTKKLRLENYRSLFAHRVDDQLMEEIRQSTNKGMAIGNERFKEKIEKLTGRRQKPLKVGRHVGWRKSNES